MASGGVKHSRFVLAENTNRIKNAVRERVIAGAERLRTARREGVRERRVYGTTTQQQRKRDRSVREGCS